MSDGKEYGKRCPNCAEATHDQWVVHCKVSEVRRVVEFSESGAVDDTELVEQTDSERTEYECIQCGHMIGAGV